MGLDLPKPRDRGRPVDCVDHGCDLEIKNEVILQCPAPGCEIIAVRRDLQHLLLYFVSCKKCNYCYPSPDPKKCVICDNDTKMTLDRLVSESRQEIH